jgi:hypothetical protein
MNLGHFMLYIMLPRDRRIRSTIGHITWTLKHSPNIYSTVLAWEFHTLQRCQVGRYRSNGMLLWATTSLSRSINRNHYGAVFYSANLFFKTEIFEPHPHSSNFSQSDFLAWCNGVISCDYCKLAKGRSSPSQHGSTYGKSQLIEYLFTPTYRSPIDKNYVVQTSDSHQMFLMLFIPLAMYENKIVKINWFDIL